MPTTKMDADIRERHDTLLHGENQLTNGHRDDHETLVTQVVILSKCVRVIMSRLADQKPRTYISWPSAVVLLGGFLTILKIITHGGTP